MKKILSFVCALAFALSAFCALAAEELPFEVDAKAAVLMDAATGQVICEVNADQQLNLTGAVKVLSALVVAQAVEDGVLTLEDMVTVSSSAVKVGGMSAFLESGQQYSVQTLLKAMLMINANDATLALADKVSGSAEGFVDKMRSAASGLGLSPVIVNPTGRNADEQAMSAKEAAVIACALCKYDFITQLGAGFYEEMTHPSGRVTELANPNKLVRYYEGCDGFATGSSTEAGYNGVFTAKRGGQRYVAVIAGAKNNNERAELAQKLLEHAFSNYESIIVIEKGKGVAKDIAVEGGTQKTVHGVAGEEMRLLLKKGDSSSIEKTVELTQEALTAPVMQGDLLGELKVTKNGQYIGSVPIVAHSDVEEASVLRYFRETLLDFLRR